MLNYFKAKKMKDTIKKAFLDNKQYYLYLLNDRSQQFNQVDQEEAEAIYQDMLKVFNERVFMTVKDVYGNEKPEVLQSILSVERNLSGFGLGNFEEVIGMVGYTPLIQMAILYMAEVGKVYNYDKGLAFDGQIGKLMHNWSKRP